MQRNAHHPALSGCACLDQEAPALAQDPPLPHLLAEAWLALQLASLSPVPPDLAWPPASVRCGCHRPGPHGTRASRHPLPTSARSVAASCPRAASAPQLPGPRGGGGLSELARPDHAAPAAHLPPTTTHRARGRQPLPGRAADGGAGPGGMCPCPPHPPTPDPRSPLSSGLRSPPWMLGHTQEGGSVPCDSCRHCSSAPARRVVVLPRGDGKPVCSPEGMTAAGRQTVCPCFQEFHETEALEPATLCGRLPGPARWGDSRPCAAVWWGSQYNPSSCPWSCFRSSPLRRSSPAPRRAVTGTGPAGPRAPMSTRTLPHCGCTQTPATLALAGHSI